MLLGGRALASLALRSAYSSAVIPGVTENMRASEDDEMGIESDESTYIRPPPADEDAFHATAGRTGDPQQKRGLVLEGDSAVTTAQLAAVYRGPSGQVLLR